ncbi:MAG: ParA family protein [Desulfobacteraceae bacterium]|nr:ParA family protein [Desulfobacteraceae bacterium]
MKIISFINMKGGVAKTTLSLNVADCLCSRHEQRVLVIDIDPQFNATQCLMSADQYVDHIENQRDTIINIFERGYRPTVGVVDGPEEASPKNLCDINLFEVKENYGLLPGSLDLYRLEMASGEGRENRLKKYLETVENFYDFVVIDTPPTPSIWMTSALISSDYYVIPVKPDPISLTGIDLLYGIIGEKKENYGLNIKCIGLVLTIVEDGTIVFRQAKENLANNDRWKNLVFSRFLPKRTEVARQQLNQQLILTSNNNELKQSLVNITKEFLERIEDDEQGQ